MEFVIYWIISEDRNKTYIGFTDNINERIKTHKQREVRSTKDFGNFNYTIIEKVPNIKYARIQEKYWKSAVGRKKLKKSF